MKRIANPVETTKLCSYGCNQTALFVNGSGKYMCCDRSSKCPAVREKNSLGGKKSYESGGRKPSSLVYKDLPQEKKDRMAWSRGKFTGTLFEYGGTGNHKGYLIQERGHVCECCKLSTWLGEPITLELEHVDGDNRNNRKDNLKLLCPNCHSFTDTWKGKNINSGKIKVTDEELIEALLKFTSIRQALLSVGLTPKGANYIRCNDLIHGGVVKLANTPGLSPGASA